MALALGDVGAIDGEDGQGRDEQHRDGARVGGDHERGGDRDRALISVTSASVANIWTSIGARTLPSAIAIAPPSRRIVSAPLASVAAYRPTQVSGCSASALPAIA